MNKPIAAPAGTRRNSQGHFVPEELIGEIDKLRDDMVGNLVDRAKVMQTELAALKGAFFREIDDLVALSAAEYKVDLGGAKGNLTLMSYDGLRRVARSVADKMAFDERLQVAKKLIDGCLERWSEGARPELVALVQNAFATDKEGQINTGRVLELRGYKIQDKEWQTAMEAIADALTVVGSTSYVRFYERATIDEKWQAISLDMSSLAPGKAAPRTPDPVAVELWCAMAAMCGGKTVAELRGIRAVVQQVPDSEDQRVSLATIDALLRTAADVGQS